MSELGTALDNSVGAVVEGETRAGAAVSAWSPLRHPAFRALWVAMLAANVGTWMQQVGAAWLMTSLGASATMIALVQTATSLPVFFLALPAGTFADIFDRRKLLLWSQAWMLFAAALLAALTYAGATTPWVLLVFTFAVGAGVAVGLPAFQAVVPEILPKEEMAAAFTVSGVAMNIARAVGPALSGVVIAASGAEAVFALNALSFLAALYVIRRWRREPIRTELPPERVLRAMRAGLRYARHAPALQSVLVRTGAFIFGASALWALLPLRAQRELGTSAAGYGVLLGAIGVGALGGAFVLAWLRRRLRPDALMAAASLVYAAGTVALVLLQDFYVLCAAMMACGAAWMAIMSSLNTAAALSVPAWVKARALALYLLVFQGGLALGSFVWGLVAERAGTGAALFAAGATLAAGVLAGLRYRLSNVGDAELEPALHWDAPQVASEFDGLAQEGEGRASMVTVEYYIDPRRAGEFREAMRGVRAERMRHGATYWGLFADASDPSRWVEFFAQPSWTEHLRQHERVTQADRDMEARALAFHILAEPPRATHYVGAAAHE